MRIVIALWLLVMAIPARADTTAVYSHGDGTLTMTMEIASTGELRVSMGGAMLEEMKAKAAKAGIDTSQFGGIVRDGETYILQPTPDGVAVIRMSDAAEVMAEFMAEHAKEFGDILKDDALPALVERGTATVNGRTGAAYYYANSTAPAIVISADPDLAELAEAMQRQFGSSLGRWKTGGFPFVPGGGKQMLAILQTGAPLEFAGMKLESVHHKPIARERFLLPAAPKTRDEVRALMTHKNAKP